MIETLVKSYAAILAFVYDISTAGLRTPSTPLNLLPGKPQSGVDKMLRCFGKKADALDFLERMHVPIPSAISQTIQQETKAQDGGFSSDLPGSSLQPSSSSLCTR